MGERQHATERPRRCTRRISAAQGTGKRAPQDTRPRSCRDFTGAGTRLPKWSETILGWNNLGYWRYSDVGDNPNAFFPPFSHCSPCQYAANEDSHRPETVQLRWGYSRWALDHHLIISSFFQCFHIYFTIFLISDQYFYCIGSFLYIKIMLDSCMIILRVGSAVPRGAMGCGARHHWNVAGSTPRAGRTFLLLW